MSISNHVKCVNIEYDDREYNTII